MFGFIEARLAQLLGIPYEPFTLNGGGLAAMISRAYFIRVLHALTKMWEEDGDTDRIRPVDTDSDIVGMKVLIHKYYYDDSVLDSLTTGALKETSVYAAIKGIGDGDQRFDVPEFEEYITRFYSEQPMPDTDDRRERVVRLEGRGAAADGRTEYTTTTPPPNHDRVGDALDELFGDEEPEEDNGNREARRATSQPKRPTKPKPAAKAIPAEPVDSTPDKLNHLQRLGIVFKTTPDHPYKVGAVRYVEFMKQEDLFKLAASVKRHIIIGDMSRNTGDIKKVICTNEKSDDSFLFISTNGGASGTSDFAETHDRGKSVAFGKEINNILVIKGLDVNADINRINRSTTLSDDEKRSQIELIQKESRNSPYAKYDKIYKDTVTNVVFALQSRNFIVCLFNAYENKKFAELAFFEIGRRFDGKLSYSELFKIDSEYQEILERGNCDEYVKFIIDSSTSVIKQLKKAYEDAKSAYEDYFTKAMESGKMCSKYMDQIESFNESEQQLKVKQKAFEEYMAVKSIPKVKAVYIKEEKVHIYTDNLYATDERSKKKHDIGTFHIVIGMHSNSYDTSQTVIIKNTKHQISAFNGTNMQAPHVFDDGHICHGTLATGMANAYKKRDLYQLVLQLILFLQQANTDDAAGKYVNSWPEVSDEAIRLEELKKTAKEPERVEFITTPEDDKYNEVFAQAIPV